MPVWAGADPASRPGGAAARGRRSSAARLARGPSRRDSSRSRAALAARPSPSRAVARSRWRRRARVPLRRAVRALAAVAQSRERSARPRARAGPRPGSAAAPPPSGAGPWLPRCPPARPASAPTRSETGPPRVESDRAQQGLLGLGGRGLCRRRARPSSCCLGEVGSGRPASRDWRSPRPRRPCRAAGRHAAEDHRARAPAPAPSAADFGKGGARLVLAAGLPRAWRGSRRPRSARIEPRGLRELVDRTLDVAELQENPPRTFRPCASAGRSATESRSSTAAASRSPFSRRIRPSARRAWPCLRVRPRWRRGAAPRPPPGRPAGGGRTQVVRVGGSVARQLRRLPQLARPPRRASSAPRGVGRARGAAAPARGERDRPAQLALASSRSEGRGRPRPER